MDELFHVRRVEFFARSTYWEMGVHIVHIVVIGSTNNQPTN